MCHKIFLFLLFGLSNIGSLTTRFFTCFSLSFVWFLKSIQCFPLLFLVSILCLETQSLVLNEVLFFSFTSILHWCVIFFLEYESLSCFIFSLKTWYFDMAFFLFSCLIFCLVMVVFNFEWNPLFSYAWFFVSLIMNGIHLFSFEWSFVWRYGILLKINHLNFNTVGIRRGFGKQTSLHLRPEYGPSIFRYCCWSDCLNFLRSFQ